MSKPIHVPPFLTQAQVNALPENTRVVVTWPGGNGPYAYVIRRPYGTVTAELERNGQLLNIGPLSFVGTSRPHTLVTLA